MSLRNTNSMHVMEKQVSFADLPQGALDGNDVLVDGFDQSKFNDKLKNL